MAFTRRTDRPDFIFKVSGQKIPVMGIEITERVSSPYSVDLSLVSEQTFDYNDFLEQEGALSIEQNDIKRFFHGMIRQFEYTGISGRFYHYRAEMVPAFWLLTLKSDCRIFQNKTTQDIVSTILKEGNIPSDRFSFRLSGTYEPRVYCVQYRETDFNFISRLLEEEGIFYFFEHTEDKHVMVFGDSQANYQPIQGKDTVWITRAREMNPEEVFLYRFNGSKQVYSGKYSHKDYNFEKPSLDLLTHDEGKSFTQKEVYDFPGQYMDLSPGNNRAKIRQQECSTHMETATGNGICARFTPGFTFSLDNHDLDDLNREYFLFEVTHSGSQPQVLEDRAPEDEIPFYRNHFIAMPSSVDFRPERHTMKPVVKGSQTAVVTGPSGEEIYTDKYGRVKVQFHWDRYGGKDEQSSCWLRVASGFAGGAYGKIFTPRIGHEVMVDFIEGDPDRPLVTGRVYNAANMPPYTLPDKKTKSTIKTDSSLGGGGYNEIRFEDAKGDEEVFIHAEKNMDVRIKNTVREWVGNDSHLVVKNNRFQHIEKDSHTLIDGNSFSEIKGNREETVKGNQTISIDGTKSEKIQGNVAQDYGGNHALEVGNSYTLKAGNNIVIEAGSGMTLKVGGNFITINPSGIAMQGTMVFINSGGVPLAGKPGSIKSPTAPEEAEPAGESGRDA